MPFTISHIAAVLPLYKSLRRLGLLSAAAIGAMSPDLDVILPVRLIRDQTHSLRALLTFSLPIGLAVWAVFQTLIKPALFEVLPNRVHGRLLAQHSGPRLASVKSWLYAASAVLFGALTHIVWDRFTHASAWAEREFPVWRDDAPGLAGRVWPLYRWLQHGSTVIGAAAVLTALWLWVKHAEASDPPMGRRLLARERHRWMALYISIPLILVALTPVNRIGWQYHDLTSALSALAVTGIRGTALGLAFTSALIRRRLLMLAAGSDSPRSE